MKFVKFLAALVLFALIAVYVLLFTSIGNSIVAPIVQKKISEALGMPVALKKFRLGMSDLDIVLYLTRSNALHLYGDYRLFTQSFDLKYDVKFLDLSELKALTKQPLFGELKTIGTLKGDINYFDVDGTSDVANSMSEYHVKIAKFDIAAIKARIKSLEIDKVLAMIDQPSFVHARLDMNLDFKNIKPHQLDGIVHLQTYQGSFDTAVLKKELDIEVPETQFIMQAKAKLDKDNVDFTYLFDSNLVKVTTKGDVVPEPFNADISYDAFIKELALLTPLTHANLRGRVNAHGSIKGTKEKLLATFNSDLADSKTSAQATLKEFEPASLHATIEHLKLEKLLYMLKQPHYASGTLDLKADISDLRKGRLNGEVETKSAGMLDNLYLTKAYKFKHPMPKSGFKLSTTSALRGDDIDTFVSLTSDLADLTMKKARFNIQDLSFDSDYTVKVPSLEKLYFVTDRHLRGGITADGEIHKAKDLTLSAFSKIAGGELKAKLVNNKLHANLENVRTKKVLWILLYPEVFDGGMYADVDYDLIAQKGAARADFKNGRFVKNQVFDALKKFGKIDLYKEYFNGKAKADINKEKVAATFDLKARRAEIRSTRTLLDTKRSLIDAKIELITKRAPVAITLKGNIAKPKVGVDLKAFMKSEAGKRLQKKADKEIKKLLNKLF